MAGVGKIVALAVGLAAVVLQAPAAVELRVVGDHVNLRAQPVADAEVVGQAMAGDRLTTPDPLDSNAWIRVSAPASVDLWMYNELIRDGKVAVNRAQVRGGPGLQFKPVGQLNRDTPVEIRGVLGDWTRVGPTEDCFLWISRQYVAPFEPEAGVQAAARTADAETAAQREAASPATPIISDSAGNASTNRVPPAVPIPLPDEAPTLATAPLTEAPPTADRRPPPAPAAPVYIPPPPLPSALRGYVADAHRIQHAPARFTGILRRTASAMAPGACTHVLVADGPDRGRRDILCFLMGFDGQLDSLISSRVEVNGRLWHLAGLQSPVLDVQRLVTLTPAF